MRAEVAREHADAHLGHDLEDAVFERGAEVRERFRVGERFGFRERGLGLRELGFVGAGLRDALLRGDLHLVDDLADRIVSQIRVHGAGTVADEAGDLMHVARFAGLADDRRFHALADVDEVMMHGADGEEHRHGDVRVIGGAVAKDHEPRAIGHGGFGVGADAVDGFFEAGFAFAERPGAVHGRARKTLFGEAAQRGEFIFEEHRRIGLNEPRVLGRFGEQIPAPAEIHDAATSRASRGWSRSADS